MAGKSVRWLRSIPSTKPDIRRSRLPIQKKNHSIRATFHTAWAQSCRSVLGRACPLCPGISDVDLFSYREGIIDLDSEVPDGAFDFGVAKQELYGSQVAGATIDQR